jgi:hypothetical protein
MEFEGLTTTKIYIAVFWVMTPCSLVGGCQRFGGTHCLHLQARSTLKAEAEDSPETTC